MRPCDCQSIYETQKFLNEQGIAYNDNSINVVPNSVILKIGPCELKISQSLFKRFAEWYLEDQKKDPKKHGNTVSKFSKLTNYS